MARSMAATAWSAAAAAMEFLVSKILIRMVGLVYRGRAEVPSRREAVS